MIQKFRFILYSIILWPLLLSAQLDSIASKSKMTFEFEVENGGILRQKSLRETTYEDAYYEGLNFKIGWKRKGADDLYNQIYHYPTYGIGFYSSTFHNHIIGNPYALYGFVQTPIAPKEKSPWSYDYRIGLGLSGNFKPFNEEENPLNLVIGSKNNVFIDFGIKAQYRFLPQWKAGLGLAFHHFSNGALALPNRGVNLVPLTMSINYQPNAQVKTRRDTALTPYPKNWWIDVNYGLGFKQLRNDLPTRFLKTTLSSYVHRFINYKWRMGGGFDLFYSSSGNDQEIAGDVSGKLGSKLSGGPSFYLAHILNQHLILNGNVGYYIHNQTFNGEVKKVFLRAGVRYYVYKNLNMGVSIKAHKGKADFIEWTTGYTFARRKF